MDHKEVAARTLRALGGEEKHHRLGALRNAPAHGAEGYEEGRYQGLRG